jgi:hypothetical protein
VFFPIAATAAVGSVIELEQRDERAAAAAAAGSAAAQARSRAQQSLVRALPPAAAAATSELDGNASPASSDSAANLVRQPRVVPTAVAGAHAEPAARSADVEPARATEIALLQRANAALKTDAAQARALAAEHRQLFPAGNLAQEREVIAIKALVASGDSAGARERLTSFEDAYPHSAYAPELRQIVR